MTPDIHPTAVVDPSARLASGVVVGPFSLVGPDVELGDGVRLLSHAVIEGHTRIGAGTTVYPFASIGHPPQDLKYRGERSAVEIGCDTTIREYVTVQPGTAAGCMVTRVGDRCLLMVGAHVAHDCVLGDGVIMANHSTLGGHVEIGDQAILGGLTAVHQFVRIGPHAFVGGMTGVEQDVIPFGMVVGERGYLAGLNLTGLRRRGFDRMDIHRLRGAFRELFEVEGAWSDKLDAVATSYAGCDLVVQLVSFLTGQSARRVLGPRRSHAV